VLVVVRLCHISPTNKVYCRNNDFPIQNCHALAYDTHSLSLQEDFNNTFSIAVLINSLIVDSILADGDSSAHGKSLIQGRSIARAP
jgi:hypothetical protein